MLEEERNSIYEDMTLAEKRVADFLKERHIRWNFEQPVYVRDNKKRPRVWTPDFFLPELGIYLEVCGAKRRSYKFRKEVYEHEDNKVPVIFVHTYKVNRWKEFVLNAIKRLHEDRSKIVSNL
ncbi:MAG: hypothetical protein HY361_02460 [Candidatus Aenigmarchaeota archaeon]|nr:hypothetical protein [Candidatus Aenigmarchaeota archaeon]